MMYAEWLAVVIVAMLAGAAATWLLMRRHRRERLSERFGPEYERAVAELEDRSEAEQRLQEREKRVERLQIVPLGRADGARFAEEWRAVQARFVDNPSAAVQDADDLIAEVMVLRGYPVGDFERRAEDLSVDHAQVVQNYRSGHDLATSSRAGDTSTEDLRRAMVHYRALFDELLEPAPPDRRDEVPTRRGWSRRAVDVRIERKR